MPACCLSAAHTTCVQQARCPPAAATHLDLSHNLLWQPSTVADLINQLPSLTTLDLSYNRLAPPLANPPANRLRVLVVNATLLPWRDVLHLARYLPQLEELHACANAIHHLDGDGVSLAEALPKLRVLDLDNNALDDWARVARLQQLPCLTRLQLNGNALHRIMDASSPGMMYYKDWNHTATICVPTRVEQHPLGVAVPGWQSHRRLGVCGRTCTHWPDGMLLVEHTTPSLTKAPCIIIIATM